MVLRPHILNYQNKLKKIDKEKMDKINKSNAYHLKEIRGLKIVPRLSYMIYGGAGLIMISPMVYLQYLAKTTMTDQLKTRNVGRKESISEG